MSSFSSTIRRNIVKSLYYFFRIFPIKKKKIFVSNFGGKGFGDSPKYIVKYLLQHYQGYDVVWLVKGNYDFPQGVRTIDASNTLGVIKSIYEQVTAKVWIDNLYRFYFERKRRGQFYIDTWHGDMGVKKVAGDAVEKYQEDELKNYRNNSLMANLFVCGNQWMCDRYREAFWYNGEIATCGLPRRDIMFNAPQSLKTEIRRLLGIPDGIKLLLYVPTFRNVDIFNDHLGKYASELDWEVILNTLQERFGGEWYGLMRLHPNAVKWSNSLVLPDNVVNVTTYPDVNELCCICECCISDYSSLLFEMGLVEKPCFIFAPDKGDYEEERGLYFTDDQLPFTVATDVNMLANNIITFEEQDYLEKHHTFYYDTLHVYPEGHASEYLAKRIESICG